MLESKCGFLPQTMAWLTVAGLYQLGIAVVCLDCATSGREELQCVTTACVIGDALGCLFLLSGVSVCRAYQPIKPQCSGAIL